MLKNSKIYYLNKIILKQQIDGILLNLYFICCKNLLIMEDKY